MFRLVREETKGMLAQNLLFVPQPSAGFDEEIIANKAKKL